MRLHRFYIKEEIKIGKDILLDDLELINQIRNVFRMKICENIIVFNGDGVDYFCEIVDLNKNEIALKTLEKKDSIMPKKQIILFQCLIKKDNFELVLQKCTEIGITNFVPVIAERSEKKNINIKRAEKIIKEAAEQSGRGDVPKILEAIKISELPFKEVQIFVADFGGEEIKKVNFLQECGVLIGPEGGFTDQERKFLKDSGTKFISLGETILRAETAAIVASAFVLLN